MRVASCEAARSFVIKTMLHSFRLILAASFATLLLSGCASSNLTVQDADLTSSAPPSQVFVGQFAFAANDANPDQSILKRMQGQLTNVPPQTPEEQAGLSVAQVMQKSLVKNLTKEGIIATPTLSDLVPPVGSMVIEGELLTVKDGNSFQRLSVGLGAGQSQVVSYVNAYMITANGPVSMAKFYSNAKSSVKPGAATTLISPAAPAFVGGNVTTLTVRGQNAQADATKTARQIAKKMDQLFEMQGWIIPN